MRSTPRNPRPRRRVLSLAAVAFFLLLLVFTEFFGTSLSVGSRTRGFNASLIQGTVHLVSWGAGPFPRNWSLSTQRASAYVGYRHWWFRAANPFALPLWPFALPLGAWWVWAWRSPPHDGPRCERCGYSLRGLSISTCPECGHATHAACAV
ncbi:MAG: hypothetical protein HBSAPP03_07130 [Phycisphaerae bacterium]|nr:MAG: hypothetical protein HBSAPP03_07130 [Phycisphaerae bacterium]